MRRAALLLAAGLCALASLTPAAPAQAQQAPAASESQLRPLADCLRNQGRLAALLVIDQSGSLRDTDPGDTRVTGLEAAISGLTELTAGEAGKEVSVGIAGFDEGYQSVAPFTALTTGSLKDLRNKAQGFADHDQGFDTDYVAAFEGAQHAVNEQAIRMDPDGQNPVCRMVMVFTDGKFDIEDRLTDTQQRKHGTSKPWAPEADLTTSGSGHQLVELGKKRLCDPGGIVDQGRTSEIFTAVVALETQIEPVDRDLLRSIASGQSGSTTCGTPGKDARTSGAYLAAANVDSLIAALLEVSTAQPPVPPGLEDIGTCPQDDVTCDAGTKWFKLDASLSKFNLLALTSDPNVNVVLTGPDGDQVTVGRDGSGTADASAASLHWTWLSSTAVLVTGNLPSSPTTWAGTWKVSFVDPTGAGASSGNRVAIYIFGDLQAELVQPAQLRKGEPGTFEVRLVNAAGQPRTPAAFTEGSQLTATISVPGAKPSAVPLDRQPDGTFKGRFTPDKNLEGSSAELHLEVQLRTSYGVDLPPVGTDFAIPLANPSGFPQIMIPGGELRLSGIDGEGIAKGTMRLAADKDGAGCAWLSDDKATSTPESVKSVALTTSLGSDESGCTKVRASQAIGVAVSADPKGTGNGAVVGEIQVRLKNATTGEVRTEVVPYRFTMTRPIDRKKEAGILGGLILLGLAIPVGILYLINFLSRRFEPSDAVRCIRVPVVVTDHDVVRADGGTVLLPGEEVRLVQVARARVFEAPGLRFAARMPPLPFSAVYGEVTSQDGQLLVADRGMRKGATAGFVSLGLGGTWVLTLDSADDESVNGTLVCFFTDESYQAQQERMTEKIGRRLPDLRKSLAALVVAGTANDPVNDGPIDGPPAQRVPPVPALPPLPPLPGESSPGSISLPGDRPVGTPFRDDATAEPRRRFGRRSKGDTPTPATPGPNLDVPAGPPGFDLPD
ncbi:vWA domain-containing protein [Aquihabitans sp. McL0605]|uniref:vWA domain-containing protein n=1 Tax=Aquihabitans sp. McL0605 TaxID=3415671 RepID=UPI003CFB540B